MTAVDTRPAAPELRRFITPEGVDLRLRIGSAGERAAAFVLDVVFLLIALIVFSLCAFFALGTLIIWTGYFYTPRRTRTA